MTPTRLRACLRTLGWSGQELARRCEADERTVRRWIAGEHPVPAIVARWVDHMTTGWETVQRLCGPPPKLRTPKTEGAHDA